MPIAIKNVMQKAMNFWDSLDSGQKTRMMFISTILFVAVTAGILYATRTEYIPLLTVDNAKTGQEVEKVLTEKAIKFKLGDNGRVLVDAKDKNTAEFALALTEGVSTSVSFDDTWNKLKLTSTESDKKQLWQNFKKNSLVTKLKMFGNVKDADVELSVPEKSMFFTDEANDKPKAFVRINTKGDLTSEQVQGIATVVSSSIEGMNPKDVTVVDNNFNVLSSETGDLLADRTSTQYKMKLKVKQDLELSVKKLYSGLADNFDYINVVANPILDFNTEKRNESTVSSPVGLADGAVISSNISKETLQNGTSGAEPGMGTNPGTAANGSPSYPISSSPGSSYKKQSETVNHQFNTAQSEFEKAVGGINLSSSSMSVALWYGQRVKDDTKINQAFIDQLKQDVAGATGIPAEKISVNKYKLAPVEETKTNVGELISGYLEKFGLFALMIALIIGIFIAMKKKKEQESQIIKLENAVTVQQDIEEIDVGDKSEIERRLAGLVSSKPDTVASLLRNWLQDQW